MGAGDRNIPVLKPGQDMVVPHEVQPRPDAIARKLYEDVQPAMVQIKTDTGTGSGFFAGKNNEIVASAHTVIGSKVQNIIGPDGKSYKAEIKALDDVNDLAILKLKDGGPVPEHKSLEFGSALTLIQDQKAYAFGFPKTFQSAYVSPGYIRHLTRPQRAILDSQPDLGQSLVARIKALDEAEQQDMLGYLQRPVVQSLNSMRAGFSGGPILDEHGKVVGVTSLIDRSRDNAYSTPAEYAAKLMAGNNKFSFTYQSTAAPWVENYKSNWQNNQLAAIGTTALGAVGTAGGIAVLRAAPKVGGLGLTVGSLALLGNDGAQYLASTDSRDSWKYGLASLADTATAGGGILTMIPRARPYGMAIAGVGVAGRVATEFIQNNWTLTATTRNDGTDRPPLDPSKYLR